MPSQTRSAGTITSDNSNGGDGAWVNPSNAGASDNVYTTNTALNESEYLKSLNFNFSIPSGATIDGIEVHIERDAESASGGGGGERWKDQVIRLVVGGTIVGNNKSSGATWSTTEQTVTFGGAADLWGLTPTDSQVNGSTFGVVLSAFENRGDGTNTASVDHVSMTVHYTESGSPVPQSVFLM